MAAGGTGNVPSGHFRSGKNSRAQCGTSPQNMTQANWTADYAGEDLDVTNFESNGYDEGICGVLSLAWSLSGRWNAAQNPFADPPGLFPTDEGDSLNLFVNVSDSTSYGMTQFRCKSSKVTTSAKGAVDFESSGMSQGSFTTPSGQN